MAHFKFEHQKIHVGQNSVGQNHTINVIDMISNDYEETQEGPFIYIQASVHGAELQGNLVIQKLIEYLQKNPFKGRFRFVPLANPEATSLKMGQYTYGRFNPQTGHNWNRNYIDIFNLKNEAKTGHSLTSFIDELLKKNPTINYKRLIREMKEFHAKALDSYTLINNEYGSPAQNGKLNLELQKLAAPADIVLDFHTGPIATRYIYCPEYAFEDALHFKFPHYLVIAHEFAGAMDEAAFCPWVYLDEYISTNHTKTYESLTQDSSHLIHTQSFTLEFGSEEFINSAKASNDLKLVLNYLSNKGICEPSSKNNESTSIAWCSLSQFKTYYSPAGGLCEYHLSPGQSFQKSDPLYSVYFLRENYGNSPLPFEREEICANQSGIVINHSTSSSVTQGAEVYQVMENPQTIRSPQ